MKSNWRKNHPWAGAFVDVAPGVALVIAAVFFSLLTVREADEANLSDLELTLYQSITLLLGLLGSFWVGRKSVRAAAEDVIRPHARSAFRRLLSLYRALARLQASVDTRRAFLWRVAEGQAVSLDHVEAALDLLATQVSEQIGTANDAMEDWRDLVPDEVQEIEAKASRLTGESSSSAETAEPEGEDDESAG